MTCRQHGTGQGSAHTGEKEKRSSRELIRVAKTVKEWKQGPPDVEAVRPGRCPGGGVASRPVGGRVVLHGHGKRSRQVLGPEEPGGTPTQVQVRRYRCQACAVTALEERRWSSMGRPPLGRRVISGSGVGWYPGTQRSR